MIELIIGIFGAGVFLVIYNLLFKKRVDIKQEELEEKSKEIEKKVNDYKKANEKLKEEEEEKVKEIQDEKNKDVTSDDIINFFNGRNSK